MIEGTKVTVTGVENLPKNRRDIRADLKGKTGVITKANYAHCPNLYLVRLTESSLEYAFYEDELEESA